MARDELLDEETGLTRNQFLIWLGQEAAPDKPIFNEQSVYIIHGELDLARFHAAFQHVIDEADALRTTITRGQGRPRAEVHPQMEFRSGFIDLSASADIDGDLEAWALQNVDTVIDLSARPFESTILKLAPDRYAWGFVCHQVLTDASSITLMYQRVSAWYLRLSRPDMPPSLQEEPSFASYVERELAQADTPEHRIREAYWNQRVSNPPDPVVFYDGRTAPNSVSHRHRVDHPLGPELTQAVREFAQTDGIRAPSDNLSVYSVFCAALIAYLHKLSGHERVAIGTTWHNRQRPYQSAIGLFMVQNPFDVSVGADDTFRTLVKKVQSEALDTKRHLPHAAGNPGGRAYDVTLNYVNVRFGPFADMPIDHHWYRPSYGDGSMQVQVHDFDGSQELTLSIDFSDDVFEAADRDAVFAHYSACLTRLMADPDLVIDSVPMITDAERVEVEAWNATERDYPREDTVVDLFRQQADRRPDAVAVSCGDERLTYAQLSRRVQDVARELRAVGVVPGTSVGVFLNRSVDLLVGVLAVLWAGGAYVPLDPAFPRERLDYMLEDSGAHVVLTQTGLHGDLDVGDRPTVSVDRPGGRANGAGEQPVRPDAEGLAYVLYTSGSTGRPKGVEIPHRALTNFLCAMAEEPGCGENDVLLAVTTLSFDIAGLVLFLPLVTGGHVEIAGRETATDGRLLRARLDSGGITILQATPATWRMLIDAGWEGTPGLKALIGGEPLPPDLVQPLIDRTDSLWNMYGPTETTIWSSVQRMASAPAVIGIGRPLANTRFHIVDAALQPVPVGVAGELLISGDGLARGYRGRPELTAEKFTALPMNGSGAGERVYRTGDLVRLTRAGQLVHLGRLDQQVKIRGFRVEVGEVEAALAAHDAVKHAVVVAHRAGTAAARLVAYIVPAGDVPTAADLRRHLRDSLPDYMVPQQFMVLADVPLTPNGKVDRRRLPDPDDGVDAAPAGGTTAMSPMEAQIAAAFCQVLDLTGVGVDDDFFELGGQSILALRLISQLGEEFGVDLPLQVLFEASTVGALSRRLTTLVSTTPELRTVSLEGTDLEQKLRSVWRAAVGLEPPADDESAVSLTDAQIVRLLARIRQEFGVAAEGLSAVEFRSDPSVTGLARLLRDALDPPPALVVPLQPHGDKAPLFLVHAGGGYVFFYRALAARLGPDQPVHAIRAATRADSHRHPFDRTVSIENLAARYIEEMKTIQPEGPYRLGGSCFGGVVAFEMAQQLLARGESIGAPVLLFDSYLGKMGEDWRDYASRTLSSVADRLGVDPGAGPAGLSRAILAGIVTRPVEVLRLAPLTVRSLLRRGRARLRGARIRQWVRGTIPGQKGRSREQEQLDTMREFLTRSIELVAKYEPKRYPGRAVLLKATVGPDPEPMWKPWLAEGLQVHVMPGEHLDMMEEPWVQQTAHQVRQALG
jgi:amino acid adenylation domain-containing protein